MGQRLRYFAVSVVAFATFFLTPPIWADIYEPPSTYYSGASATDAVTLKSQLRTIVSVMTGVNYGDARFSAPYTDPDFAVSGNIKLIYSRDSVSGAWSTSPLIWNREHIWPQSLLGADASNGTVNIASDQHNLRPSAEDDNTAHGNRFFGLDGNSGNPAQIGANHYYPGDVDAGDVARAVFYMATRWSTLSLTENSTPTGLQMGDLSSLLYYHFKDAPDMRERYRNHAIYGLAGENSPAITNPYKQSNRNPYVDRPEFVWAVFGSGPNNSQVSIVGGADNGDGGYSRDVDFGSVFVGSAVPAAQDFTLNKNGTNGTYIDVTATGEAISSLNGRFNTFRNNTTDDTKTITIGLNPANTVPHPSITNAAGLKTGTVTINNIDITNTVDSGRGSGDANDVFNLSLTVLEHARPSFFDGVEDIAETFNLGTFEVGDPAPTIGIDVFHYATNAFTADLDFDSFTSSGDSGVLTTDLGNWDGLLTLDPNASHEFMASMSTATEGMFSATYTLNFSDEDIAGALNKSLTLTLVGEVMAASVDLLLGDYNRDNVVDGLDYAVWRNTYGEDVDEQFDGADGDGDLMIGDGDFDVWKQQYGQVGPPPGGGGLGIVGVPEPSTLLLAFIAIVPATSRRRK